jgi:hypothetical protein
VGRINWLIFELLRFKRLTWSIEEEWLADERLPRRTRRTHEWQTAQAALARTLMSRWAAEDGHPGDLTRAHSHKD